MNAELKPCPFCGGEAKIINYTNKEVSPHKNKTYVECSKCNSGTGVFTQKGVSIEYIQEAIEAWNRRVDDEN